jgi:ribose transport system permease protein
VNHPDAERVTVTTDGASQTMPTIENTDRPRWARNRLEPGDLLRNWGGVAILALLIAGFSLALPSTFPTSTSVDGIMASVPLTICVSLAILPALVAGEFDLSIGYLVGLSATLLAWMTGKEGIPLLPAIGVELVSAVLLGAVNSFVVLKLRMNSFIGTLATGSLMMALILVVTNGSALQNVPASLTNATYLNPGPVPLALIYVLVIAAVAHYLIRYTPTGRYLQATGANLDAARLGGINTQRLKFVAFLWSGLVGGIGGILILGQTGTVFPTIGADLLLPAFATAFLGATMVRAGEFNVPGLLFAALLLQIGTTGLAQLGASTWVQPVFQGVLLICAVSVAAREWGRSASRR